MSWGESARTSISMQEYDGKSIALPNIVQSSECKFNRLCVSYLGNPESVGVLSSLAGRNLQRRLLQQCMCGGLCVFYLGNPESVGVRNSLAGRKVQHRLLY